MIAAVAADPGCPRRASSNGSQDKLLPGWIGAARRPGRCEGAGPQQRRWRLTRAAFAEPITVVYQTHLTCLYLLSLRAPPRGA